MQLLRRARLFVTPWTIHSMEFSRPEYWSGQPFPSPRDLPDPGIKPRSPSLQADSLPAESQEANLRFIEIIRVGGALIQNVSLYLYKLRRGLPWWSSG